MTREATRAGDRAPGGFYERDLLDFSTIANPCRPDGVNRIYETALCAARSHPHDDYCEYRIAAGEYLDVDPRSVVPTAGGLEAVRLATTVAVGEGDRALLPTPAVGEYASEVRLQGGEPDRVPHDELLERDPAEYAAVLVCNPNDPTGHAYGTDDLLRYAERCRAAGTVLVVDEAFLGYTNRTSLAGQPGIVVTRAPAQLFGLPGVRFGFAVATGDLGEELAAARRTWALSTPAADVGAYCLQQREFVERTRARVAEERARLAGALATAYDVRASEAPFLLLDVGERDPGAVVERARERGAVIRDATSFEGLDDHVRVSVRRPQENDHLLYALGVRERP